MKRPVDRHQRCTIPSPTEAPAAGAVFAALTLLHQQWLAVYQRLYAAGLTTPGARGAPFRVERSLDVPTCIEVTPAYAGYDEYQFHVRTPEDIDGTVAKCELIIAAMEEDRPRIHPRACCPLADSRGCVLHGPTWAWKP